MIDQYFSIEHANGCVVRNGISEAIGNKQPAEYKTLEDAHEAIIRFVGRGMKMSDFKILKCFRVVEITEVIMPTNMHSYVTKSRRVSP